MAEAVGRAEDQADREEQRAGGSTETNQSSQGDTSTVCKLGQHIRDLHPSSCSLQYMRVHHIGGQATLYVRSECRILVRMLRTCPSFSNSSENLLHSAFMSHNSTLTSTVM